MGTYTPIVSKLMRRCFLRGIDFMSRMLSRRSNILMNKARTSRAIAPSIFW